MAWLEISQAKQELIRVASMLRDSGVMFRGEHANLSARVADDRMVLTRGGNVAHLDESSFALVQLDGKVLEGEIAPAQAEIVEMHAAVYRARAQVGSVIHTHAPHATAFAVAHQSIPVVYEPLMRFGITAPVPVVPWAPRGSAASVAGIIAAVQANPGISAVLLANHGVLAFAANPTQTAQLLATLDEAAELILAARQLGGEQPLPEAAFEQIREAMRAFATK
ncbi:class II aldolase/adducin family protein [Alicyclobacillaceae bacterium I2511]|nr:class II aldolase/adducin family protein [Alicyclobacillaceae bacterium I2511]